MDVRPHEITARFQALHRVPVRLLGVAVVVIALAFGATGLRTDLSPPGLYRPTLTEQQALRQWCSHGQLTSLPPNAGCQVSPGEVLDQAAFQQWQDSPLRLRIKPPHPSVWAVLFALVALGIWRVAPAVSITLRPNGVWMGRRFIQADDIRDCKVRTLFDRPYVVVFTPTGLHRTVPLSRPHWEIEALCAEIRALGPDADEVDEVERTEAQLSPRMQALLKGRQRDTRS